MDIVKSYRKVFIVGCPRSGTSWTSKMLGMHPETIALPTETHIYQLFYDPFTYLTNLSFQRRISQSGWILKHYGLKPLLMGFKNEDIWHGFPQIYKLYEKGIDRVGIHHCVNFGEFNDLISQAQEIDTDTLTQAQMFIRLILDQSFYKRGDDSDKTMVEKTPMHIRHAGTILNFFPEAKIIEVVRDVRDVVASWQSRAQKARWAKHQTSHIIRQWLKCITLGEKYASEMDLKDRIYRIKYEELRKEPFLNLSNTLDFVGLSSESKIVEMILDKTDISKVKNKGEGEHVRQGIVGSWRNELSKSDIVLCHELAGSTLTKLGYSVP